MSQLGHYQTSDRQGLLPCGSFLFDSAPNVLKLKLFLMGIFIVLADVIQSNAYV